MQPYDSMMNNLDVWHFLKELRRGHEILENLQGFFLVHTLIPALRSLPRGAVRGLSESLRAGFLRISSLWPGIEGSRLGLRVQVKFSDF